MTTITNGRLSTHRETVDPPGWVWDLLAAEPTPLNGALRTVESGDFALVSGVIPDADTLAALDLQHAVCSLYLDIWNAAGSVREPVRLWNFIPGIHARMGSRDGGFLDRYMVFNAGRFAAYTEWYGEADMGPRVATATGIGHSGSNLAVHCLFSRTAGIPVENPRQVPAYRYSRRRGPMPPVFARATIIGAGPDRTMLVGGTSSVRGESSAHLGDVRAQALETFRNLASLVHPHKETRIESGTPDPDLLAAYQTLRIYFVRDADKPLVHDLVLKHFPRLKGLELFRADVCRRTLLVEIEGTAACPA
jgi:chorismate lyase / 3-hydroxybenzoate synthase